MPKEPNLLTAGNTKIGNIFNWSIPAITCCPGRSSYCETVCYACNGFYHMANVKASLQRKFELSKRPRQFREQMIAEIHRRDVKIVRIHVAGDWYSAQYIDAWRRVLQACPDTLFYTYTRSWSVSRLLTPLRELAVEPNMLMWLSDDYSMPQPPAMSETKIAYLSRDDDDVPPYEVDLIFREDTSTVAKTLGPYGVLVCPVEQGIERQVKITCESCGICFKRNPDEAAERTTDAAESRSSCLEGETLLPQLR